MGLLTDLLNQHEENKRQKDTATRNFYLDQIKSGNLSPLPNPNNDPAIEEQNKTREMQLQHVYDQIGKASGTKESKGVIQQFGSVIQHAHQKIFGGGGGQPPATQPQPQGQPAGQRGGITPPPPGPSAQGATQQPMSEQTPIGGSSTNPPRTPTAGLAPPPPNPLATAAGAAFPSPETEDARKFGEVKREKELENKLIIDREKAKPLTPSQEDIGKTVETGDGVFQFNPNTQRYDIKVGASKKTATDERDMGKTVETGDGVMQFNPDTKRYDIKVGPPKKIGKTGAGGGSLDDDEAMVRDIAAGKATMPTGKYGAHLAGVAEKMGVDLPDTPHNVTARDKFVQPLQKAIDTAQDANDYASGSAFSGAGDDELMNKFQQMIQAGQTGTGIRFTKNEQDMLNKARGWQESIIARGEHALGGTYYSEKQRKEIAQTMQGMADRMKKQIDDYDKTHGGGKIDKPPAQLPDGKGKKLDASTAKQFLDASSGDKDKARTLAKQNHWTF